MGTQAGDGAAALLLNEPGQAEQQTLLYTGIFLPNKHNQNNDSATSEHFI